MLRISTFGGLDLRYQGEPVTGLASRKAEALLVYLACIGRPRTREVLAELLWEERPQRRAMSNLRVVLSSLRKRLGPYVDITRDAVALNPEADVWLDVAELEKGLSPAGSRRGALTASAVAAMEEAIALYRGDFLEGFYVRASRPFEDWAAAQREQLRRVVLDALNELAVYYGQIGDYKAGIRHAARLLELDPLMEEAYRQMMRLLSGSGQRAAALAQYETCCRLLEEELGVGPAEETTALCEQIRDGTLEAPFPSAPSGRERPPSNPPFSMQRRNGRRSNGPFSSPGSASWRDWTVFWGRRSRAEAG
jgi:DNA-binding SARP family transcriptional activator